MKIPNILLLVISLGQFLTAQAQRAEITPLAGYQFGGSLDVREGKLKIGDALVYGVSADVTIRDELQGEFFWIRQDTEITLEDRTLGETRKLFDAAIEYYHVGALYLLLDGPVRPFGGFSMGIAVLSPQDSDLSSETRFSGALTGGLKIFPTERIGIRMQFQLLMPFQYGSAGIFCGSGGCSAGVGGSSTVFQGSANGGIILAF